MISMFSSGHLRHWQKEINTDGGNENGGESKSHVKYAASEEIS